MATRLALAFRMGVAWELHGYTVAARMAALVYRDGLISARIDRPIALEAVVSLRPDQQSGEPPHPQRHLIRV